MRHRPKLLVLTQTHNTWGGIEAWMEEVFPYLTSSGWDVEYGLARGSRFNDPSAFLAKHSYIERAHILDGRVGTASARRRAILTAITQCQPDIVMPLAIGDTYSSLRHAREAGARARMVVAVHSTHAGTLADVVQNHDIVDMCGVVSGLIYRWAKRTLSDDIERIRWIRNGVPAPEKEAEPVRSTRLRVGYVGRLDDQIKRVRDVPAIVDEACKRGVHIELEIVGDGPCLAEVRTELRRFGGGCTGRLHGRRERTFIYEHVWPKLHCVLLTSSTEGSPLAIIEAMHHGVVPVVSEFHGVAGEGLLRPNVNCLMFPIGDISTAASHLVRLSGDSRLLDRLAKSAKQAVAEYGKGQMLESWRKLLEETISRVPRTPLSKAAEVRGGLGQGRLEQLGVPVNIADLLRGLCQRTFPHQSGFDEWPGSICSDGELMDRIRRELENVEAECRDEMRERDGR